MKKIGIVATVILFIVILVYAISLKNELTKYQEPNLFGTYKSIYSMGNGDYFIFYEDGKYLHYRQFEEISLGECEVNDNVILMISENKNYGVVFCEYNQVSVYFVDDEYVVQYAKISDIPNHINIKKDEGSWDTLPVDTEGSPS